MNTKDTTKVIETDTTAVPRDAPTAVAVHVPAASTAGPETQ